MTEVDDEHLIDFLEHASPHYAASPGPTTGRDWRRLSLSERIDELVWRPWSEVADDGARQELLRLWRLRSIHVHVWDANEFAEVLVHATERMGHGWEVVDASPSSDDGRGGIEFGYVLRRPGVRPAAVRVRS